MNPFLLGVLAIAASGVLAYAVYHRVLRPRPPITTRSARGRQFAAALVALVMFTTLGSALATWDDSNRWIAVPLLSLLAWPPAYLAGWAFGPKGQSQPEDRAVHLSSLRNLTSLPVSQRGAVPTTKGRGSRSAIEPTEEHWSQAWAEVGSEQRRPGIWARAYSEANGDDAIAKAKYINWRAAELADERITRRALTQHDELASKNQTQRREELRRLASAVSSTGELTAAKDLTRQLGYTVTELGGSWFSSPRFEVAPPDPATEPHLKFDNWEKFVAWVQQSRCRSLLREL